MTRTNQRALKALDRAIYDMNLSIRWRLMTENAPPGSAIGRRAHDEWQKASERAHQGFTKVRKALGYDPDEDEPQPKRHWDAGA